MANNDWQEFLFIKGGVFDNGTISSFGNTEKELTYAQNENVICDLSHLDLLEISGDDAVTFLQGQVTNDVKLLSDDNAHYTGYCSPKGRLLALFLAYMQGNKLYLQLNHKLAEPIAKRLKMYVMRSQVTINNISDATVKIGLSGNDVPTMLSAFFPQVPQQAYEASHSEHGTLIRLPSAIPRFEIIGKTEKAKEIWQALKTQCKPVGKPCWEWLEIQAGIPDIVLNTQEEFVPQMVNLDCLDAINFKKGCYTGQEIVARTHYLGKVKRRTQLAHIETSTPPQAGNDVLNENNETVGKIVRSAPAPAGGFDVLAEIRLEALAEAPVYWNGTALSIQALPYPLEDQ
ncbi:MAG: folate-binding protein YgfZ [Methylotenera sp.]